MFCLFTRKLIQLTTISSPSKPAFFRDDTRPVMRQPGRPQRQAKATRSGTLQNIGHITSRDFWLVVEPYPSKKYDFVSWEGWHPIYEMENKKCLKPPTSSYRFPK